eukprot:4798229-Prymnesium_polylepis.1
MELEDEIAEATVAALCRAAHGGGDGPMGAGDGPAAVHALRPSALRAIVGARMGTERYALESDHESDAGEWEGAGLDGQIDIGGLFDEGGGGGGGGGGAA